MAVFHCGGGDLSGLIEDEMGLVGKSSFTGKVSMTGPLLLE